jgi:hypothetical protein
VLALHLASPSLRHGLYHKLNTVFGVPPLTYWTGYDTARVVFVEGKPTNLTAMTEFPEIGGGLQSGPAPVVLATHQWPFLFLARRRVPVSMLLVLLSFIALVASCAEPAQGLGMNLLGAVVGGGLENLVMGGGIVVLGVMAIILYGIAAASLTVQERASIPQEAGICGALRVHRTEGATDGITPESRTVLSALRSRRSFFLDIPFYRTHRRYSVHSQCQKSAPRRWF